MNPTTETSGDGLDNNQKLRSLQLDRMLRE
jgi:hypothetical protein